MMQSYTKEKGPPGVGFGLCHELETRATSQNLLWNAQPGGCQARSSCTSCVRSGYPQTLDCLILGKPAPRVCQAESSDYREILIFAHSLQLVKQWNAYHYSRPHSNGIFGGGPRFLSVCLNAPDIPPGLGLKMSTTMENQR